MVRVKRGVVSRAKHKKILRLARGYRGRRRSAFRVAKQAVIKSGQYSYIGRKLKKRNSRSEWISTINAEARRAGTNYSSFMRHLHSRGLDLDRPTLCSLVGADGNCFFNLLNLPMPSAPSIQSGVSFSY